MQTKSTLYIFLDIQASFLPKAEYVFSFFGKCLGVEIKYFHKGAQAGESIDIYYGYDGVGCNATSTLSIANDPEAVSFF